MFIEIRMNLIAGTASGVKYSVSYEVLADFVPKSQIFTSNRIFSKGHRVRGFKGIYLYILIDYGIL